jgi:hypothetical protein
VVRGGREPLHHGNKTEFPKISGRISTGQTILASISGNVTGDQVTITAERQQNGGGETLIYRGRIDGEILTGSKESIEGSLPWQATREQGTKVPLDDGSRI